MLRVALRAERAYAYLIERDLGSGILVQIGSHAAGFREDAHPYVPLWMKERDTVASCAKALVGAGFESRRIAVEEE